MKKAIAMRWVEALRSKQSKQGTGQLRNANEFCCLGVLCNLHAQDKPKFAAQQSQEDYYGGEQSFPPRIVQNWAGLKNECGEYQAGQDSLADLNDDGNNFFEIADIIEKNWRKL